MPEPLQPLRRCLACDHTELWEFVNFGSTPLANAYQRDPKAALPRYPLVGNYCPRCWHAQLSHAVDPDLMFRDYLYVSSTSETFRAHCRELASFVHGKIRSDGQVLDLACNDGLVMECFRDLGHPVAGVDPAENLRPLTEAKGLDVEVGYWTPELARKLVERRGRFAAVIVLNVLPHVADPYTFLKACLLALEPGGIILVQNYYAYRTYKALEFDQFYHEHISYWMLRSLETLAASLGLYATDAREYPIHGGSIRVVFGTDHHAEQSASLAHLHLQEALQTEPPQLAFARALEQRRDTLRTLVQTELDEGRRWFVGYGAAAKANTALAYFGIQPNVFVDDNQTKWGTYMPRHGTPIWSPDTLANMDDPLVLITAWNFADEIKQRVASIRGKPTRFVVYQPEVAAFTC